MNYLITEDKLQSVFNKYLNEFKWDVEDFGDLAVFGNGLRLFDTFEDYLAVNPDFYEKLQSIFGDRSNELLLNWFNDNFEWESHPLTDVGPADFYDDDEEDEDY